MRGKGRKNGIEARAEPAAAPGAHGSREGFAADWGDVARDVGGMP